jgi:hypothetical protein
MEQLFTDLEKNKKNKIMNNKNILIGTGVVIVGYLLWKKSQKKSLQSPKQMECESKYLELAQPSVIMPQEYWDKRKEDWMKINCK